MRNALISGYGIAGASIAYWLTRAGWDVTVVERDGGARSSGNPVDVRGEAVDTVRAMGCYDALRARATGATRVEAVDRSGRRIGGFAMEPADGAGGFEIARSELARVLAAAAGDARIVRGETIVGVRQNGDGVEATLAGGARIRADVLVGADGIHSAVRGLVMPPEDVAASPLGIWIATLRCALPGIAPSTVRLYNRPGRLAAVHPGGGHPGAALMVRAAADAPGTSDPKAFLASAFAGSGWLVPDILRHLAAADDVYFDAVAMVRVRRWWSGRAVLLGDAASSVTIFGDGSSMAIVGARELARALEEHALVEDALAAYETAQRRRVDPKLRGVWLSSRFLVPASRVELAARNALIRAISATARVREAFGSEA